MIISFILNNIPEAAWKSMGNEVVNQICNITYYDKTTGGKEDKRQPRREILNIITKEQEFLSDLQNKVAPLWKK